MGLEISFIFAIPAAIAVFVGKEIDARLNAGSLATVIALAVAFIFSWALVLVKYYRLNRKLKEINSLIKQAKEKNHD